MLLLGLDHNLAHYASANDPLPVAMLRTIWQSNAELWWRDLLREASSAVPDPALCAFSDEVGFSPHFVEAITDAEPPLKGPPTRAQDRGIGRDGLCSRVYDFENHGRLA
jgi:hypothetical protein